MKTIHKPNRQNAVNKFFLLLILFFATENKISAQHISTATVQTLQPVQTVHYGLVSDNGKKILDSIYDEVKPIGKGWPLFTYRKDDKIGLYNAYDSTLYPCIYDEVINNYDGFVIRQGNKFGYVMCVKPVENHRYTYSYKVIQPIYNYVNFDDNSVCLEKDSLYGLFSLNLKHSEIIPFIAPFPIYENDDYGFYYRTSGNTMVLLRLDSTKKWTEIQLNNEPEIVEQFIIDRNEFDGEITVYDKKTCQLLSYFPPVMDSSVQQFFSHIGMCIERDTKNGQVTKVEWYNPYNGNLFFTTEINEGDKVNCDYRESTDVSPEGKIYVHTEYEYKEKDTYLGTINGYDYVAFDKPEIEKSRTSWPSLGNSSAGHNGNLFSGGQRGSIFWIGGH